MRHALVLALGLAGTAAAPAGASILLAIGTLAGTDDLSGLTGTLENGLQKTVLGGLGSGLANAGGNIFVAVPDRGPNANPYNPAVDDTTSYIGRFHTLTLDLTAGGGALPYSLTPTLKATTLLSSGHALNYGSGAGLGLGSGAPGENTAGKYYFTGRSDNFGAGDSGNPANARFDPESVRVSLDGRFVFISDEYGPYVRQFNRTTGRLVKTFALPANLNVANLSPSGATEIGGNTSGRVANKGMEGLALTPDGKTLVGIIQAPAIQDAAISASSKLLRIVTIDIASGVTKQYGYLLTTGSGVSDIVAISNTKFLVDERDGKGKGDGSSAKVKQAFSIDLAGATEISGLSSAAAAAAAVGKTKVLDIVAVLNANGIASTEIPAKIEGFAFGEDVSYLGTLYHTLYVSNDNDFVPGVAGPNNFYVFGLTDAELPGYLATQIAAVPEPASWALMIAGFGMAGTAMRRARRVATA